MPDNMSGTVCIVKNKAALFPSAGGPGSEPHSTYLYTHLGLPTGTRPHPQNEHRSECLSPTASSAGQAQRASTGRKSEFLVPRRGSVLYPS